MLDDKVNAMNFYY